MSCSGGAGHIRAAVGLYQTSQQLSLPVTIEHHDVLDFTSTLFKKLYANSYLHLVNKTPELWGYMYHRTEQKPYSKQTLIKLFDRFNYQRYIMYIKKFNPDVILCTHFLPYLALSTLTKQQWNFPFYAVTTDFDVHQLWINPLVDRYYVFCNETAWQLSAKGIEENKIVVSGVPLLPQFSKKQSKQKVRQQLRLPLYSFTILVMSGGFGVGQVDETIHSIVSLLSLYKKHRFTLIIICGNNQKLFSTLRTYQFPDNIIPQIIGYTESVSDYMDAADVLVSKSGGLTSSEALAKHLPMIIVNPIPGQETRNADILLEHGCCWKAHNTANVAYKLKMIIEKPSLLQKAQTSTRSLAKPNAATDILKDIVKQFRSIL